MAFASFVLIALGATSGLADNHLPADWAAAPSWLSVRSETNGIVVADFKGRALLRFNEYELGFNPPGKPASVFWGYIVRPTGLEKLNDHQWRISLDGKVPSWMTNGVPTVHAIVTCAGGPLLEMRFYLTTPAGMIFGHDAAWINRIRLQPCEGTDLGERFFQGGVWKQPEHGVAYEGNGAKLIPYSLPEGGLYLWHSAVGAFARKPLERLSTRWQFVDPAQAAKDAAALAEALKGAVMPATMEAYAAAERERAATARDVSAKGNGPEPAKPVAADPSEENYYTSAIRFFLVPWKDSAWVPAAIQTDQQLAGRIETGRAFNLFDSSHDRPSFDLITMNPKGEEADVRTSITVRDYDGATLFEKTTSGRYAPYELKTLHVDLPGGRERAFYFVEAAFETTAGRSFIRSHIGVIPPYAFKHPETNIMGIAAFFDIPDRERILTLCRRMGVRWMRSTEDADKTDYAEHGMVGIRGFHLPNNATNELQRREFAREKLLDAKARNCRIVEIGNELNFGANTAEKLRRVRGYIPWLETFYNVRHELGLDENLDISTFGLAGSDNEFLGLLAREGGWRYIDVVSLHPGRLNQTPDNPAPEWQWNYLSQINVTKDSIRRNRNGRRIELILTEVYARTPPNKNDSDSLRTAAENVVLSAVLAKVEGVKALNWYQMHDSMHADRGGVNEYNTEWHYGLLWRDGTVKPSAVAFCTAAEALDGAEYSHQVFFEDARKGYCFNTPDGPMALLFDRKDGYYPYPGMFTGKPFEGHLDPWIDHWRSHTAYTFRSRAKEVVVVDPIGRRTSIPVRDGLVRLTLSGTPLFVYGLDL